MVGFRKRYYRGPGSVISDTLAAWRIKHHAGCDCTSIAADMDSDGPDLVEKKLEHYTSRMKKSIKIWRKVNWYKPIPQPPDFVIRDLILYGISKSREEKNQFLLAQE